MVHIVHWNLHSFARFVVWLAPAHYSPPPGKGITSASGADQTLNSREVVRFLNLDKKDVAKLAGIAPASVRFDQKVPKEVLDRLREIANVCGPVAEFFAGDAAKTGLWFRTVNPLLGSISPRDMIRYGRDDNCATS